VSEKVKKQQFQVVASIIAPCNVEIFVILISSRKFYIPGYKSIVNNLQRSTSEVVNNKKLFSDGSFVQLADREDQITVLIIQNLL